MKPAKLSLIVKLAFILVFCASYLVVSAFDQNSQSFNVVQYAHAKPKPPKAKAPRAKVAKKTVKVKKTPSKKPTKPKTTKKLSSRVAGKVKSQSTKAVSKNGRNYLVAKRWKSLPAKTANSDRLNSKYKDPVPYKPNSKVFTVTTKKPEKFIRVFNSPHSERKGGFMMRARDIKGLTPKQIKAKFALKYTPNRYTHVTVPAGTKMFIGKVNKSSTGAVQYQLRQQISPKSFERGFALKKKF